MVNSSDGSDRRAYLKALGAAGVGVSLGGCLDQLQGGSQDTSSTDESGEAESLTLGGTMPLTGALASTGEAIQTGYKAAIGKINEMGGVPVGDSKRKLELNIKDDASDPDRATSIYQQQITQENIDFFVGSFSSGIVLPTASIVEKNDKLMVQAGGGSDEIFTQGWQNIYGIYPRATRQMRLTVESFTTLDPKPSDFVVITENDAYSKSLSSGVRSLLKENGFNVVANHGVPEGASDVSSVVSKVKSQAPDALFVAAHGGVGQQVAKAVDTRNVDLDLFYEVLGPWEPNYLESVGDAGNGVMTITYFSPNAEGFGGEIFDSSKAFAEYTRENVEETPTPFNHQTASGAAGIVALYHALKNAGEVDVGAVSTELQNLSVESFYGTLEFTEDGDGHPIKMGPKVAQIQDGNYELIYPADAASADPQYPLGSSN